MMSDPSNMPKSNATAANVFGNLPASRAILSLGLGISVLLGASALRATEHTQHTFPAAVDYLGKHLENSENLIWTGHLNPDTDSFVASMLAAYIHGGSPSVPGPINPESRFALEACNAEAPPVVDDFSGTNVGLVDFNQSTQLPPSVDPTSIVAIIDHHAIGGTPVNLANVVSIEIRPWGAVATILADQAAMLDVDLPQPLACMGMAAILSDTVNLTLPTTTEYDRAYVQSLAATAGITDIDGFAEEMLLAKSDLSGLSAGEIVLLDYKDFDYNGQKVGIGVAETLTADQLVARRDELKAAIAAHKEAAGLDHLVFAIVDTRNQKSFLLWGDDTDRDIVVSAFGIDAADDMVVAEDVISRKRQIGPAVQRAVEGK
ncbi:MAG: manganese-dependent inorganic pyrophosphatase [Pseudomonadota bacterium]